MCKQGSYPSSASDGTVFYEGNGTSATKSLAAGTWYFRAWNYMTTNIGRMYGGYGQTTCANNQIKGQQTFTSSGTFTVPSNVRSIDIFCVGGGGGGQNNPSSEWGGGGGSGGYTSTRKSYSVSPGQTFSVTIGAGGDKEKDGNTTSFGTVLSANGGKKGTGNPGSNGGSGGGHAGWGTNSYYFPGGSGGSNGSNGSNDKSSNGTETYYGGTGQGTTTRSFGESSGSLYSGGGGGGGTGKNAGSSPGSGGSGGGGSAGSRGSANTGGGGGGGGRISPMQMNVSAAGGGSGICIVRWGY